MLAELWASKKKQIITAVGVLGTIVSLYTGLLVVDDRYVHAADFAAQIQKQENTIKEFRAKQLEDKLFELDFKIQNGEATPLDKALKERYSNELRRIK